MSIVEFLAGIDVKYDDNVKKFTQKELNIKHLKLCGYDLTIKYLFLFFFYNILNLTINYIICQLRRNRCMLPIILAINDEDDRNFVEDIYNQYGKKIYKVAFDILRNEADASDCFHDVIKIIIDNLERFRSANQAYLVNLLVKCTRNAAINKYNREKRRRFVEVSMYIKSSDFDEEDTEMEFTDDQGQYDDILINEENRKRLAELISELDMIYQDVLYLRYQMWMTNAEIAKLLSVSENTVKVRLYRARKILLKTRSEELNELRKN